MKHVFIYYIEQFCFKKTTELSSAVLNEENTARLIPATIFFCLLPFIFLLWTLKICKKQYYYCHFAEAQGHANTATESAYKVSCLCSDH